MSVSRPFSLVAFALLTPAANAAGDDLGELYALSLSELSQTQVVEAASGFTQRLHEAPATVSVIEQVEWQARGASTLSEALQGTPGLQVYLVNSGNTEKRFKIRGLSGNYGQQVKVLIDGVPYNRIHHGGIPGLDLPLHSFKRIEVVRSPGSVVYGADAFGGVINLVSDTDFNSPDVVSVTVGSFDQYELNATKSINHQAFNAKLNLSYYHYGDDSDRIVTSDLQSSLDAVFGTNASRTPNAIDMRQEYLNVNLLLDWQDWVIQYLGIDGKWGMGAGIADALDPGNDNQHYSHLIKARYTLDKLIPSAEVTAWYLKRRSYFNFTILPKNTLVPIGADGNLNFTSPTTLTLFTDGYIGHPGNRTEQYSINVKQAVDFYRHQMSWQMGYEKHVHHPFEQKNFGPGILTGTETVVDGTLTDVTGTDYVYLPYKSRELLFAAVQDNWQLTDDLVLNIGARFDRYSDFGSTINPRAGLIYRANNQLTMRLFNGSAFRAPSFIGLHSQNNPVGIGSEDLESEEIDTTELTIDAKLSDNLTSSITFYQYQANKLVQYLPKEHVVGLVAQNTGKLDGNGVEWQARWRPTRSLDININYSHINLDLPKGQQSFDLSEHLASTTINYQFNEQWNLNFFARYSGSQQRRSSDSRKALAPYFWLSTSAQWQFNQQTRVSFVVNNLLDDDQARYPSDGSVVEDYPYPGRQFLAKLQYRF